MRDALDDKANQSFAGKVVRYVLAKKSELGIARDLDTSDLHVAVIDLVANRFMALTCTTAGIFPRARYTNH